MLTDQDVDILISFLENNEDFFRSWCTGQMGADAKTAEDIIESLASLHKSGLLTSELT